MFASRYQTVVRGEASETDSEEEIYLTSVTPVALSVSETEGPPESIHTSLPLPLLIVIRNAEQEEKPGLALQPHSRDSTLLQLKLLESNSHLGQDIQGTVKHMYQTTAKELQALTSQFSSSQNGIISASHSIRLILDDLRSVAEKIDIIATCSLLPDITPFGDKT
uniref:Biogenesis of lysosome-related organelles complex 1 subunit 3 n=1 Tax=Geotrypetes seraphini TaxID=260995 RepID=A0A6P8RZJ5_GEOSA|nr:biogenesis of lysosome-related organelles complex 1 subunit 3 [Geotrypetes seraphini]XP_033810983.1 biogenesis of lysosome-related organelles complex 1 subunit 3 [Geotrypetes seraphini]XP_033810984.1 biogenesis of lysosome-related organelles complex 1 subunit 3 [Geotrypetes seraphini]